jgi:UDP-glucose 4-epimerase
MKYIITGAAGFIGSTLTDTLLADPAVEQVIGIDAFTDYYARPLKESNLEQARENDRFQLVEQDIQDVDWIALLSGGIDGVFHLAAQAGVRASWGDDFSIYSNTNILATQRLLEACREPGIRVVAASSSSVYGETKTFPMKEEHRPQPVSPYGVSKLASENLGVLYHRNFGLPTVNLRYFTVYGPRQRPDMAFMKFIKAGFTGAPIHIYGDGEQTRDFTFVQDAVAATIGAMKTGKPGGVYNIGGGSRVSVNEMLKTLEELVGQKLNIQYTERAHGDVTHTFADTSAAKADLHFEPQVSLREGLQREIEWYKEHHLAKA